MANRNLSQLPENTDPQDTDWILGASGNSPSVLQKMAIGNLPGSAPSGGGGSIKFALPINQNHTLTSSGYYFTDNIASDIEIDCSNLGIGEHIYWQNLSTKAIVFNGLNSIDSVSIPANKGVKITSTNFIQFFLKDANKNLNKIAGNHSIDWIPGLEPPTMEVFYNQSPPLSLDSSMTIRNSNNYDVFYQLGTNFLQESFINPHTRGAVSVTASGIRDNNSPPWCQPSSICDNYDPPNGDQRRKWCNFFGNGPHWLKIDFLSRKISLTKFLIRDASSSNIANLDCQGSNDNMNWVLINDMNVTSSSYLSPNFSDLEYYRYIRFFDPRTNTNAVEITEIYLWGILLL